MLRVALILTAAVFLIAPTSASAASKRHFLAKTEAREQGLKFVTPFGDLLEMGPTNTVRMVAPRKCRRVSHVTVTCAFSVQLVSQPRVVRGVLRIHRHRDGFLGFLLPWDPAEAGLPSEPIRVAGD